jgi:hypothetical protein
MVVVSTTAWCRLPCGIISFRLICNRLSAVLTEELSAQLRGEESKHNMRFWCENLGGLYSRIAWEARRQGRRSCPAFWKEFECFSESCVAQLALSHQYHQKQVRHGSGMLEYQQFSLKGYAGTLEPILAD